jgi:hypothetical protein
MTYNKRGTHSHSLTRSGTLLGPSSRSAACFDSSQVHLCVPIPSVAKPRPRVDDVFYLPVCASCPRYRSHCNICKLRCAVYNLIDILSCSTRQPTGRSMSEVKGVEDTGPGKRTYDRRGFLLESSRR